MKSNPQALGRFEGHQVVGTQIQITNAGDGLSAAMSIDPESLKLGERVFVVLETQVSKVAYTEVKDTGTLMRVQTLKAGTATTVDESLVADVLESQRVRIEEAQGVVRLEFENGDNADAG